MYRMMSLSVVVTLLWAGFVINLVLAVRVQPPEASISETEVEVVDGEEVELHISTDEGIAELM